MVNRYDSPAQAQFIDTYVPIPFEQLYTLGKLANDKVDKAINELNTAREKFGEFRSRSQQDMKDWYDATTKPIMPYINQMAANPDLIKDASFRSKLSSAINSVDTAFLSTLKQNAANFDEYKKMEQTLMLQGKGNPLWHNKDFSNYSTRNSGLFDETPIPYMSINELSKPYMDQLKPGYIETKGGYDYFGNTIGDLETIANKHLNDILITPQAQMHMQQYMNATGATKEQAVEWLRQSVVDSNMDRVIRTNREINPYAAMQLKAALAASISKKSKGDEDTKLPSVYDQQYATTDMSSLSNIKSQPSMTDFAIAKTKLDESSNLLVNLYNKYSNGEITKDEFNDAYEAYNEASKEVQGYYQDGLKDIISNATGIADVTSNAEVSRKKQNLFNGGVDVILDAISGDMDAITQSSYDMAINNGKEAENKIFDTEVKAYNRSLGGYELASNFIFKMAGIPTNNVTPHINVNGHTRSLQSMLNNATAWLVPRNKAITGNVDGVNTLNIEYTAYVPIDQFQTDSGWFVDTTEDQLEDYYGKNNIVKDKDGNAYLKIPVVKPIKANSNEATSFSQFGIKDRNTGSAANKQAVVDIYTHQNNLFK